MTDDLRDTVPAMPVPSRNPIAEERERLEGNLREFAVAIMEDERRLWVGLIIRDSGVAERYTIELLEPEARTWLVEAKKSARIGAWIPTVCPKCDSIQRLPDICETCLRGNR